MNLSKDNPSLLRKIVTHHRVLTYLIQERIISCYGKMMKREYRNADLMTGKTAWCDFLGEEEWGEITLIHQKNLPVLFLRKSLFTISIEEVEEKYQIKVDLNTIPSPLQNPCASPTVLIDTQSAIEVGLEKKLKKSYPHQRNGFSTKGTLILAICDPMFSGFSNNLEIRFNKLNLESLKKMAETFVPKSCFNRVLLVDSLASFHENLEDRTYELLR